MVTPMGVATGIAMGSEEGDDAWALAEAMGKAPSMHTMVQYYRIVGTGVVDVPEDPPSCSAAVLSGHMDRAEVPKSAYLSMATLAGLAVKRKDAKRDIAVAVHGEARARAGLSGDSDWKLWI